MSLVLTASQICGEALGAIGEYPVTESAPDGEVLRRAMTWLDLIMAQEAGSTRLFNLIPAAVSFEITNGTTSYDLNTALGADLPIDRVQFPVQAWLEDEDGNRTPLEIASREKFDRVSKANETGVPCMIHIDRLPTPTARIYPTPASTDTNTYTVKLVVQTFAPNVAPGGVTGSQPQASVLTGFRQAWQRWLICQLAHDLGSGPIRKIGESSLNRFDAMAKKARLDLEAFENREHDTEEPVCEAWSM